MKNRIGGILFCFILLTGCATTSTITVKTDPEGANIYLDGRRIGQTPATIKLTFSENAQMVAEKKILAVSLPGYRERKEIISPEGASQKTLEFLLVPTVTKSAVQVASKPTSTTAQPAQEAKPVALVSSRPLTNGQELNPVKQVPAPRP